MLKAGAKAPAFTLDDGAGGRRNLQEILSHGAALVAFYKVGCPVCQLTFPFLERISKGSLQVIGVSQDNERDTGRFRERHAPEMTTLFDRDREDYPASNAFGISHVPSLFVIEQDGTISTAWEGFSRRDMESLGARAGVATFRPEENVPEWKAG
jgi:peroxiredoxin